MPGPVEVVDILRYAHLVGLAAGLGLALHADVRLLRLLAAPVAAADLAALRALHPHVAGGLLLLWATGLALVAARGGFGPAGLPDKLAVKIGLATLLSANAVILGRAALPALAAAEGRRFGDLATRRRLWLGLAGGLSLGCWAGLLALPVFPVFATLDAGGILARLAGPMAAALAAGIAAALLAPGSAPRPQRRDLVAERAHLVQDELALPHHRIALAAGLRLVL